MKAKPATNTILCAGRVYCDLVFTGAPDLPTMGTETFAKGLSLHAGGGALISATAFSALGWDTSLLAILPSAPFDGEIQKTVSDFGLDTTHCINAPCGASPQITVAIAGKEDRAFLSHKVGKAIPDIVLEPAMFRHLHIGELRSVIEHPGLIDNARRAEMTVSTDCGWDTELLGKGDELVEILSKIDVFLPNKAEYAQLIKSGLTEGACPLTVVKCGDDGARAFDRKTWISQPAIPANVVDATGAGDAFNGGFLSSWLSGEPLAACLASGNRCGRASVEEAGGTGGLISLKRAGDVARIGAAQ